MGWKKGSVIMEAQPYAHVIMQTYKEQRCNHCLSRSESLKKCASCKKLWYCRQQCQKEDWKIHKAECPILQRVPDLPTDSIRLYLRLILLHQMGKASVPLEKSELPCIRSFKDLESHCEDLKADSTRWELFEIAADFIRAYTHGLFECPREEDMLAIFGKMVINTFTITDEMLQDVAVGVYNSPSILDHHCSPNATASFEGRRLTVRVLEDVPKEDFTQVYVSYVDPLALREERDDQLRHQYYFTCTCGRCQDDSWDNLMLATEGSNQGDNDAVKTCLATLEDMKTDNQDPKEVVAICQACVSQVRLPATNLDLVKVIGKAFDAAIEAQMWQEALAMGRKVLGPYEQLYPPCCTSLGYFYAHLGKLMVFVEEVKDARHILKKAFEIFLVTLGGSHDLTRQVMELVQQCQMELSALTQ